MLAETEMGVMCLQAKAGQGLLATPEVNRDAGNRLPLTALRRSPLCPHLDFGFLVSRTVSRFPVVKPPHLRCLEPAALGNYRATFT